MSSRDGYLRRKYGITEAEYDAMLVRQGGVCALCGKKPGRVRLAVDHDHVTHRVRGLLHARCNKNLGAFEWSNAVLTRTAQYMSKIVEERANA